MSSRYFIYGLWNIEKLDSDFQKSFLYGKIRTFWITNILVVQVFLLSQETIGKMPIHIMKLQLLTSHYEVTKSINLTFV